MKRLSAVLVSIALAATVGTGAAAGDAQPRAQLRGFVCQRALDPANRSISVQAVMRPLPATWRMALKVDLLVRRGGPPPTESSIRAGDLGVWISPSNPTLGQLPGDVWKFDKSVVELDAPASYRFRFTFHWIGARDRMIGSTVRYSPRCRERELRPDLLVSSITVSAITGRPQQSLYTAAITNAGATGAGPFDVLFTPGDSSPPETHTVKFLGPGQTRTETFVGPLCTAASAPTITADSAGQVDDLNRANNALTATCPAPSSP
jgi:hypothetical protein